MTGQPRNRRRRGRRGQRPIEEGGLQPEQEQTPEATPPVVETSAPQVPRPPRTPEGPRAQAPVGGPPRAPREAGGGDSGSGAGQKRRSRGKRRPNRGPMLGPMPNEVLKENYRRAARPTRIVARRALHDLFSDESDGVQFGCPMLTRTRLALPFSGNVPSPRCSMGWAVHSETEVAMCLRTPTMLACWKQDEEREARLRAELEADAAAD